MKTDTLFYSLFQAFPGIFFELVERPAADAIAYEFASREIKQLAFRLDGLFLPITNAVEQPFYVVEIQFQPDEDLYYRIFGELFLFLKQYKTPHPWQLVVIYPSRAIEREQPLHFQKLFSLDCIRRIYLDELGELAERSLGVGAVKLVIEPEAIAGVRARQLIEQARQQIADEAIRRDLINLIETIIVYKLPKKSREEIAAMLGLTSELKQTRFYQDVFEEGREEGQEEGQQRGELQAQWITFVRMRQLNLGVETIAQVLDLPVDAIEQMTIAQPAWMVEALIDLLDTQPSLFSPADLTELAAAIAPLPDKLTPISEAIAAWLTSHESQLKAHQQGLIFRYRQLLHGERNSNLDRDEIVGKQLLQQALQSAIDSSQNE
jgi:predicted transposase/invertase (TIGR01784 family)